MEVGSACNLYLLSFGALARPANVVILRRFMLSWQELERGGVEQLNFSLFLGCNRNGPLWKKLFFVQWFYCWVGFHATPMPCHTNAVSVFLSCSSPGLPPLGGCGVDMGKWDTCLVGSGRVLGNFEMNNKGVARQQHCLEGKKQRHR